MDTYVVTGHVKWIRRDVFVLSMDHFLHITEKSFAVSTENTEPGSTTGHPASDISV